MSLVATHFIADINTYLIPFDWLDSGCSEAQLRLVARILTPNGRRRLARSRPIAPNPIMKTYMGRNRISVT